MKTHGIATATLGDIGRFLAGRLGDATYAAIARSSVAQLRYDGEMLSVVKDPGRRGHFTLRELNALVARIEDPDRRAAAARELELVEGERSDAQWREFAGLPTEEAVQARLARRANREVASDA